MKIAFPLHNAAHKLSHLNVQYSEPTARASKLRQINRNVRFINHVTSIAE